MWVENEMLVAIEYVLYSFLENEALENDVQEIELPHDISLEF